MKKLECRDCHNKLTYVISNIKAPNNYRINFYTCKTCTEKDGVPKNVVIMRTDIKAKNERTFNKLVIEFILAHTKK